jgi:2'-5' RNA ligase
MAGEAWRLFLALWPPEPVRGELARLQQAWDWPPSAALVKPERLHVTLHFIGNVEAARIDALEAGLRVPFEPFVLDTRDARATVWRGGIAVLELGAPPALQRLHATLADALRAERLPVEARAFRPHVTFGRKAFGAGAPAGIPQVDWPVSEGYVLARTVPGRGYTIVHRHP